MALEDSLDQSGRLKPGPQGEEMQGPRWVRQELEQGGAREGRKASQEAEWRAALRGAGEEGQVWEEAKANVGPGGCERPGGCPGSRGKPGLEGGPALGTEMWGSSAEKENRSMGACGEVPPQKEVSGEAGRGSVPSPGVGVGVEGPQRLGLWMKRNFQKI